MKGTPAIFGNCPIQILQQPGITKRELQVYIALASFQGTNPDAFPSLQKIAERSGINSIKKVSETITKLSENFICLKCDSEFIGKKHFKKDPQGKALQDADGEYIIKRGCNKCDSTEFYYDDSKNWIRKTQLGKKRNNVYQVLQPISNYETHVSDSPEMAESVSPKTGESVSPKLGERDSPKTGETIGKTTYKITNKITERPPSIDDIEKTIIANNYNVNADKFYTYYTNNQWLDKRKRKVTNNNFHQKLKEWDKTENSYKTEPTKDPEHLNNLYFLKLQFACEFTESELRSILTNHNNNLQSSKEYCHKKIQARENHKVAEPAAPEGWREFPAAVAI